MYLILALDEDIHADAVLFYLKKFGKIVKRFDPAFLFDEYGSIEQGPRRDKLTVEINSTSGKLIFSNGDEILSDNIEGILCRSFYFPKSKDSCSTEDMLATAEIRSTVKGFFSLIPDSCRWINNPYIEEKIDNKIYQHQFAIKHGLKVPDTLVTNDASKVKEFFNKHNGEIVIKQLSDIFLIDEKPFVNKYGFNDIEFKGFYTSAVTVSDLNNLDDFFGPGSSPVLLQQKLEKKSELRVTVVGDRCFSYRIFSQENELSQVDYRHVDNLETKKCLLPDELSAKLIKMLKDWNISFSAIDLVETVSGEIFFLEANVVGNWLWLEKDQYGSEIARAIAELLAP